MPTTIVSRGILANKALSQDDFYLDLPRGSRVVSVSLWRFMSQTGRRDDFLEVFAEADLMHPPCKRKFRVFCTHYEVDDCPKLNLPVNARFVGSVRMTAVGYTIHLYDLGEA